VNSLRLVVFLQSISLLKNIVTPLLFIIPFIFTIKTIIIANKLHYSLFTSSYSYLKASTGFLLAALNEFKETVNKDINMTINPAKVKIHQLRVVLYA